MKQGQGRPLHGAGLELALHGAGLELALHRAGLELALHGVGSGLAFTWSRVWAGRYMLQG
jgi:hypothetical protein